MVLLRKVMLVNAEYKDEFPFSVPVIRDFTCLEFKSPVTIFVGENGTGKSTLLEGIATKIGLPAVGGESLEDDVSLEHGRTLSNHLKLAWSINKHRGFFLRAEDFFNFTRMITKLRMEMKSNLQEINDNYKDRSEYAQSLARLPYVGSLVELEKRYGEDLDANSHGESFLKLFESRFVPEGVYILDEPEAPLSPLRQLSLISMIKEMVKKGCQFIIATHSPILMAFPYAEIISFDEAPFKKVEYNELEHVRLTRDFLNNPESFLRHL